MTDICKFCNNIISIPVRFGANISDAKEFGCLTCVRDNGYQMYYSSGKYPNIWFNWDQKTDVYQNARKEALRLDEKYGNIECPRGCGFKDTRHNMFETSHLRHCPNSRKFNCKKCPHLPLMSQSELENHNLVHESK